MFDNLMATANNYGPWKRASLCRTEEKVRQNEMNLLNERLGVRSRPIAQVEALEMENIIVDNSMAIANKNGP